MTMPEVPLSVLLAQIWNWFILAALIVVAFLIGRDARRRVLSWPETIAWAVLTLFVFPIGLGLYFLVRRRGHSDMRREVE